MSTAIASSLQGVALSRSSAPAAQASAHVAQLYSVQLVLNDCVSVCAHRYCITQHVQAAAHSYR
jgi:hypothetical protein